MEIETFGFGGSKPVPCSSRANSIAEAVLGLVEAKARLDRALDKVPGYTGQWSPSDYYAKEQEAYYRAADELEQALDNG